MKRKLPKGSPMGGKKHRFAPSWTKTPAQLEIQHYFPRTRTSTVWALASETRGGSCIDLSMSATHTTPLTTSGVPGSLEPWDEQQLTTPEQLSAPLSVLGDPDLRVSRLEDVHHWDLQLVWTEVQSLSDRLTIGETSHVSCLQLQLEESEDWSRRNNLRSRGISKDTV